MSEPTTSPQERLAALAGHDPERSTGPIEHPHDDSPITGEHTQYVSSTPTDALPTTPAVAQPSHDRSSAGARRMLRRMVMGEAPPTQAISLVDRLAGSPYAKPKIIHPETAATPYEGARKTLDLSLHLAEVMFRFGAGALEVETSIIAVTAAYGLRDVEVDITNQSVQLNYSPEGQTPITVLRVVRSWTNNYAGLVHVHDLVTQIVAGGVTRKDAMEQLKAITRRPKPFPRWMVTVAGGLFCGAIALLIGGDYLEAALATLATIISGVVGRQLALWRVPDFYSTMLGALTVTAVSMGAYALGWPINPAVVVAGGLVLLVPSGRTVSAVQDAINGFPVTSAGRLLSAMLSFGAIVVGIALAVVVATVSGVEKLDVTGQVQSQLPFWGTALIVFVAGLFVGVFEQTALKLILPTALVAVAGYFAFLFFQHLGFGARLTPALSAVAVGFFGRIVALRMGAPQLVVAVPAVLYLLPGLAIFRSMYTLAIEESTFDGVAGLASALMVILGLAGGTVAGDNLARPLTRKDGTPSTQRRGRRR